VAVTPPRPPLNLPLVQTAWFARTWTLPMAAEGSPEFADLDRRIVRHLEAPDDAALRADLEEVLEWARTQQHDARVLSTGDDRTAYDALIGTLETGLNLAALEDH
jgi:hypothetical protein